MKKELPENCLNDFFVKFAKYMDKNPDGSLMIFFLTDPLMDNDEKIELLHRIQNTVQQSIILLRMVKSQEEKKK